MRLDDSPTSSTDEVLTIDSPLENLALYLDFLDDGVMDGLTVVVDSALQSMLTAGLTDNDLVRAASLFVAAAGKIGTFTVDDFVCMNTILAVTGIDPIVVNRVTYVAYADFSHDGVDTWSDVKAEVLVCDTVTDSWTAQAVDVLDVVFGDAVDTAIAGFTLAADDALQVIDFVHEYEVPTTELLAQ